jgi:hypothetical protein
MPKSKSEQIFEETLKRYEEGKLSCDLKRMHQYVNAAYEELMETQKKLKKEKAEATH